MDLPLLDREIETVEDLLAVDLDVQVFDFKPQHPFLFHVDPSSEVRGQSQNLEG